MENTPKTNKSAGHAKAKRGRPKKKPGYDRTKIIDELLAKTVELFGMPYDDREERPEDSPTIASVANTLQMTPLKVRKLLITAGYYMHEKVEGHETVALFCFICYNEAKKLSRRSSHGNIHHA